MVASKTIVSLTLAATLYHTSAFPTPNRRRSVTFLSSASTQSLSGEDSTIGEKESVTSKEASSVEHVDQIDNLSLPWSDVQKDALTRNLPKYSVKIPLKSNNTPDFVLWRSLLQEVPELTGYPIDFLQKQASNVGSLPYLDQYDFTATGGLSGKIYGIPGLAEGSVLETSSVTQLEVTLPQGFVRTADGLAAYELGRPAIAPQPTSQASIEAGDRILKSVKTAGLVVPSTVEDGDGALLRLGGLTGVLLAGATAVSMLSHHLTVNVFWV